MAALREQSASAPACTRDPDPSDACIEDLAREITAPFEVVREASSPETGGDGGR